MTKRTGMVMAAGAAFAAALIGLAPEARADEPDPFQLLFGDSGINTWTPTADTDLAALSPTLASDFATSVDSFDASASGGSIPFIDGDSPFRGLLDHFDSSAFTVVGPDNLLIPDNAIGDFATGLDYAIFASGGANLDVDLITLEADVLYGGF